MVSRTARIVVLVAVAIAPAAAPCIAAFDRTAPCPMEGCGDEPYGALSSPCCCAEGAAAPAPAMRDGLPAGIQAIAFTSEASPQTATAVDGTALENDLPPPQHVPLFLLHAALLR